MVAESLVTTNLFGHDSHGVLRVKQYVNMIRAGMIKPAARPRVRKRFGATAMVSNGYGFGQTGARFAAQLAMSRWGANTASPPYRSVKRRISGAWANTRR